MCILAKVACSVAVLTAVAVAPARAQFAGGHEMAQSGPMLEQMAPMIEQMAPMLETATRKIGRKRMSQMMQMVGPMMESMMGGEAAFGGVMPAMESFTGLPGPTGRARKRAR